MPWVVSATLLKWRCIGPGDKSEQRATATCPVNYGPSTRITLPERTYGTGERVDLTKLRTVVDDYATGGILTAPPGTEFGLELSGGGWTISKPQACPR